ncbi:hypothetical protein BT67DRAFT_441673 [Trichocladium antarcticum]|uniref:Amino acid transporter transmembrane domain-containing protein n=1 Tax=Trichocladium antarcticum TaxID=1450529 RepID=A0AAN6ZE70_9PEZI|nr:hypothetical protein BT67DRAFT_441673 [Trichocladium antarcticum]
MEGINPILDRKPSAKKNNPAESANPAAMETPSDNEVGEVRPTSQVDFEKQKAAEGEAHFHQLGWKRLTIVLIVTAVALGSLSLPGAFAVLGMVPGVILTVGIGLIAMYSSYVIGQVKIKYPHISHYADVGGMLFGKVGYEILGVMFVLQLCFTTGSHVLTGAIMFENLSESGTCTIVFTVVSAIILFIVAIPPTFSEMAVLGYIDFASIIVAIFITIVATGVRASDAPGGMAAVEWTMWPRDDISLAEIFIGITNIVFAYSYALCQFSFMDEMHTPGDYTKSIYTLGIFEIFLYTITGATVYAFVGPDVRAPALLSAGPTVSKVAFGVAIPVIFISGSINTTVVARYLHQRMFKDSIIRYVNTPMGWATWIGLDAAITLFSWIVASAIPFFSDLLAICSSLFISGFTFYFPSIMWYMLIREGSCFARKNLLATCINALTFSVGMIVLGVGTYSSIWDIMHRYDLGLVSDPFSCAPVG